LDCLLTWLFLFLVASGLTVLTGARREIKTMAIIVFTILLL